MAEQEAEGSIVNNGDEEEERIIEHYSSFHQILLVGEGDFSFSLCLAQSFRSALNIVASSLHSYDEVIKMYKNAKSNTENLKALGGTVLHCVDATKLQHHTDLRNRKFDRIIFNFPHAGFYWSEDDNRLIQMHKNLVANFFRGAIKRLRVNGEVHVTHKTTPTYARWDLQGLASENSLTCIECADFNIKKYPGYNNKRGAGPRCDESFDWRESKTFKFIVVPNHNKNKQRTKQNKRNLYKPSVRVQENPNSISSLTLSSQQQLHPIGGRSFPIYVNDMSGFPSHAGLTAGHDPRSEIFMNSLSFRVSSHQQLRSMGDRNSPNYVNDMSGFQSYAGLLATHDPRGDQSFRNSVSSSIYASQQQLSRIGSRIFPSYVNGMNGFPSDAGLPARHDPRSEFFRIFKGYFKHIQETFGREDNAVEVSVRQALRRGSLMYWAEPERHSESYLYNWENFHCWSRSRYSRLQQMLQELDQRLCEPQGMGYYL